MNLLYASSSSARFESVGAYHRPPTALSTLFTGFRATFSQSFPITRDAWHDRKALLLNKTIPHTVANLF